jgi:hypothetical protein
MIAMLRNRRNTWPALVLVAAAALPSAATPGLLPKSFAGDRATWAKAPAAGRVPKLREVVEVPEDYVGREFTYTVRLSTNGLWMKRGAVDFFIFVEDLEGSQLPSRGLGPDSTVNLIRFILPKEAGRTLIDQLSAAQKYEARIRFRVERERDVLGSGWSYLARISSVELVGAGKSK